MKARLIRFLSATSQKIALRLFLLDEIVRMGGRARSLVGEIMQHPSFAEDWVQLLRFVGSEEPVLLVDIGAHHGVFSAGFLKYWEDVEVVALEPAEAAFRRLQRRFKHDPRVECLNHAISDQDCEREMLIDDGQTALNTFHHYTDSIRKVYSAKHARTEKVSCRKLTSTVTLPLDRTVVVKIDVQGHEVPVVEGSLSWFRNVDAVLCEVSFSPEYEGLAPSFVRVAAALASQNLYPIAFQSFGITESNYAFERDVLFVRESRLQRAFDHPQK